jgi:hypothetical protein
MFVSMHGPLLWEVNGHSVPCGKQPKQWLTKDINGAVAPAHLHALRNLVLYDLMFVGSVYPKKVIEKLPQYCSICRRALLQSAA